MRDLSIDKIWMFHPDPSSYVLRDEMQKRPTDDWEIVQHRADVMAGDRVVLWQSGDNAGIYGLGKLAIQPYQKDGQQRIDIQYTEVLKTPLLKANLLHHPILRDLLIIRMPNGKNSCEVTAEEYHALKKVLAVTESSNEWKLSCKIDQFDGLVHIIKRSYDDLFFVWFGVVELNLKHIEFVGLRSKVKIRVMGVDGQPTGDAQILGSSSRETPEGDTHILHLVGLNGPVIPIG